jgi:hypothetical protein
MPKVSAIGPGTEVGKLILQDYLNWKTKGFKPFGKGIGGANHWKSCSKYMKVSHSAFRKQAQEIAKIAREQLPADEVISDSEEEKVETTYHKDSEKRNPWVRSNELLGPQEPDDSKLDKKNETPNPMDDESYKTNEDETGSADGLEGFEEVELGELQNSRAPFFLQYPTGDKLLAIFPLDGNVLDPDANQFEFIQENNTIHRWAKVPKERENCVALIGLGSEKASMVGFTDVDLMVVDAEIQKRLKDNKYKRDKNGDIWEIRATLQLPFKCQTEFYSRDGTVLKTFRVRSNGKGFSWGYFWLLAWKPPQPKPAKRIGGSLVKTMSKEEASVYTEKTYESKKTKK